MTFPLKMYTHFSCKFFLVTIYYTAVNKIIDFQLMQIMLLALSLVCIIIYRYNYVCHPQPSAACTLPPLENLFTMS
jgi:hypothetical protein